MISHEENYSFNTTKKPRMLFKLDLLKDYDKLNWEFVFSILRAFAFANEWIN